MSWRLRWQSRRFRVGVFVLGAASLFFGLVLFIIGSSLGTKMTEYYILFDESVKGMVVGSKVSFHGIPVGSVADIRFAQGKSKVTIAIDRAKAPIQKCTVAFMDRKLITGQVSIELEGYKGDGKLLRSGGVIPAQMSAFDMFARSLPDLISSTDDVVRELSVFASRLGDLLNDKNRAHVSNTLANIEKTSAAFAKRLDGVLAEVTETLTTLRPAVQNASVAMKTVDRSFAQFGELAASADVRATMASAREAMGRLDRVERQLYSLLTELAGMARGSRRQLLQTLSSAQGALDEVRQMARNLRIAPNALLLGRSKDEPAQPSPRPGGRR